jgi:hypothetical protein
MEPDIVLARPTVTLPTADGKGRLVPGFVYWVDRADDWVAGSIKAGILIVEEEAESE